MTEQATAPVSESLPSEEVVNETESSEEEVSGAPEFVFEMPDIEMSADPTEADTIYLDLDEIDCSPQSNTRDLDSPAYSTESIGMLAAQIISVNKLLDPLTVFRVKPSEKTDNKSFKLSDGYRRSRALRYAAEKTGDDKYIKKPFVRCTLITISEDGRTKVGGQSVFKLTQIISNIREDLEPLETAKAFRDALAESQGQLSPATLAKQLGMNKGTVSQYLKLLEAPEAYTKL